MSISPPPPTIRYVNPPTLANSPGYSQVVEARPARSVYVSGQVALDRDGNPVGAGDLRAQTEQVFLNLQAALAAVGAGFTHVVKLTYFVTELDQDKLMLIREVRGRYLDVSQAPASTLVQVVKLFRPELLIEVDAIALIPE